MTLEQKSSSITDSKKLRYALIIGILAISFSMCFMIRSQPGQYGYELNEFDPFFNYRATGFIVENGFAEYLEWNDDMSWHPYGRDVSATSQVMLHLTTATLYPVFSAGSSLYDFTIWFPVVIGSLTTIVIFGLVRIIGGTTAGLLASLLFCVSPMLILRGSLGWFKSEPLGIFYGLLATYLLLSGIKSDKGWISFAKIAGGGIILALGMGSWGGVQFFILPIGFFFLALPFLRKDSKFVALASVIFISAFFLSTMLFEETGATGFISSLSGFFLIGCTLFLITILGIKKIRFEFKWRNIMMVLGIFIIVGIVIPFIPSQCELNQYNEPVCSSIIDMPAFRYLNAANPFLIATDILTDSISEHNTLSLEHSFYLSSILMVFAGIGAWLIFQSKVNQFFKIKNEMAVFALITGILAAYFSSAFIRLEVFGSIAIIILASIGVSILASKILNDYNKPRGIMVKSSFIATIVILLIAPTVLPLNTNWIVDTIHPPTILNGATHFDISTNDWPDAMEWLKENTEEDAVIASWWDYGYWITGLSDRKTLADNSTLIDWQIEKIASMLFSTPEDAWMILTSNAETDVSQYYGGTILEDAIEVKTQSFKNWENSLDEDGKWEFCGVGSIKTSADKFGYNPGDSTGCVEKSIVEDGYDKYPTLFDYWHEELWCSEVDRCERSAGLDADYVLLTLAALKLSEENELPFYMFGDKGGDETKAFWILKIADHDFRDYYSTDGNGFTDRFWSNTLFGHLIPFTPLVYVNLDTEDQSPSYKFGYNPIYVRDNKFSSENEPFQLVYLSPSLTKTEEGPVNGVLIYKVNKEYVPNS